MTETENLVCIFTSGQGSFNIISLAPSKYNIWHRVTIISYYWLSACTVSNLILSGYRSYFLWSSHLGNSPCYITIYSWKKLGLRSDGTCPKLPLQYSSTSSDYKSFKNISAHNPPSINKATYNAFSPIQLRITQGLRFFIPSVNSQCGHKTHVGDWTTAAPTLRLLTVYLLLNRSLLISFCFVVISIFPMTEIWPRNKNAVYLIETLLFEA